MKTKLEEVRELGAATAEEWFKGLELDGVEKLAEIARWEHWELTGGFQAITHSMSNIRRLHRPDHEMYLRCAATSDEQASSRSEIATFSDFPSNRPTVNVQARCWTNQGAQIVAFVNSALVGLFILTDNHAAPPSTLPPKPATPISHHGSVYPGAMPNFSVPASKPSARVERSIYDVNEKKNARRAEIERRCAELSRPIKPSTLALMDSFAAALQIAMPLTDQAWERLKPRLLAQREAAEQQEREQLAQNQFFMQQTEERKQQEAQLREAKETLDRDWAESQKSVREKLEIYADNFIREQWQNGDTVTKSSCAQFAADMLLHVRHRFYNVLAQEDARMRSMGVPIPTDSPHTATTRKLTLENMRWVYENKIKPLTEHFQKELFLCNACDNHGRYYSLDSVVQHFAAKHTDSLSMGTAVVYWKADWPELPPFDPNPTAAKASMYAAENSLSAPAPSQSAYNTSLANHGYAADAYIPSSQTIYSASFGGQYAHHRHARAFDSVSPAYQETSSPRNAFQRLEQVASRGFNPMPESANTVIQRYGALPTSDHFDWRRQGSNNILHSHQYHVQAPYPSPHDFNATTGSAISHRSQNPPFSSVTTSTGQFSRPQLPIGVRQVFNPVPAGQPMGIYQVQIQELAQNAREIWNGTSGISDMPDSVRVQVIICHVVLRFKDKYTNEPNLALFTDGLNNNSQMSPMRALSGLYCKACATANDMSEAYGNIDTRAIEQRMHTLPALLAHFQSAHVEHVQPLAISPTGIEMPRLDWKFDMVRMPAETVMRNLMYSPGITQAKLNLIATVLPKYFPSLRQVDPIPYTGNDDETMFQPDSRKTPQEHDSSGGDDGTAEASFDDNGRAASQLQHVQVAREDPNFQRSAHCSGDAANRGEYRPVEVAREDEYDPHRPAYVNTNRSQNPSLVPAYSHKDRPHDEHEAASAHGLLGDRHAGQTIEAAHPERAEDFPGRPVSRLQPEARWANQEPHPAQVERKPTPAREPYNAAEQFLRSFDLTTEASWESNQQPPAVAISQVDQYSPEVSGDTFFRPRSRNWLPNHVNDRTTDFSGKLSPSDPVSALERYETAGRAVAEPRPAGEYNGPYGGRLADPTLRSQRSLAASSDHQTSSRARGALLPGPLTSVRDSPSRRPNSRFERYEAQRQGSQRPLTRSPALDIEPLAAGDEFHLRPYQMQRSAPRQVYAAESEERHRGYPYTDEIMYRRAPDLSEQIHYVEKARYLEPTYDRQIEYVRVAPRDSQAAAGYYMQRPVPPNSADGYVGYEPNRPHEQVFERNGHLYTRAPPSSQDYRDPYARQVTYQ
jgi:hypothetical protein